MPMCEACQKRKAELTAQGVPFEERPLAQIESGEIPAAALDAMGLIDVWSRRMLAGEPHLVAPVEIERDNGKWGLVTRKAESENQC